MHFPAAGAPYGAQTNLVRDCSRSLPALVVFSPWRWTLDWQRPQHLLTRLAKHYRVIVVEEPVMTHAEAHLARSQPAPGVEVLVPHTPIDAAGFHDDQAPVLQALLADFAREHDVVQPIAWLYTPMALPLAQSLSPRGVLVDVMDDLAAAPGVTHQMIRREAELMKIADVVIAGGPSLYQSRRSLHSNVHCIPSAVDAEHFAPPAAAGSSIETISARSIHADIPRPRLGYFGAIDERIDLDLVARVCDQRPDWQIVMAGPVVDLDPATLPQRPNLHWIGAQTYAIAPHLQAHWDVCLLPLKCDASARHASPHQTLAYLAGQKSVVSTPVHDVVALHGHIVRLAADANGFVEACRAAMSERGPLRRQRRIDALIAVHSCTWDRAADRVHKMLVEFAREETPAGDRSTDLPAPAANALVAAALQQIAGQQRYALG